MTARSSFTLLLLLGLVLVGCAIGGADVVRTAANDGVLTGSVAYKERVALPPNTVVEIRLLGVSVQDIAAPVIAETTMASAGRQVPIPFELRYDPGKIRQDRTYVVRAVIRSAGRMIFTTDTAYHVITQGNPTQVNLWLVRIVGSSSGKVEDLRGTAWRLEDLGGAGILERVEATLEFPEAGKVAGSGSCNRFFGTVKISGESIQFSPLGATRMACVEAVMVQEEKYLQALRAAERFMLDGSTLLLYSKGTERPLRFVRKNP